MYLKVDTFALVLAICWFLLGVRVVRRVPLIHDPMLRFSRYHPRVAPLVYFLLVLFWPFSKLVWRFVFFLASIIKREQKIK